MPLLQKLRRGNKSEAKASASSSSMKVMTGNSSASKRRFFPRSKSSSNSNNKIFHPSSADSRDHHITTTDYPSGSTASGPMNYRDSTKKQKEPWEKAADQERHRYALKELSHKLVVEKELARRRNSVATQVTEEETTKGSPVQSPSPSSSIKDASSSSKLAEVLSSSWQNCTPLVRPKGVKVQTARQVEQGEGGDGEEEGGLTGFLRYALCAGDLCGAAKASKQEQEQLGKDGILPLDRQDPICWDPANREFEEQDPVPHEISFTNAIPRSIVMKVPGSLSNERYSLVKPQSAASSLQEEPMDPTTRSSPRGKKSSWLRRVVLPKHSVTCGPSSTVMDKLQVYVDSGALCTRGDGSVGSDITTPDSIQADEL